MNPVNNMKISAIVSILRTPFVVLIALFPGLFAAGQVKFTTVASSREIGRGDYLQIEFVVENAKQIDQLNPPDFPGFQVAQGPIQSSGMSIVNGNMSQYKSVSFVLQPTKTGKFTIQGASAEVDGKHMQSNAVTVTVNNSSSSGTAGVSPNTNPFPSSPFADPFGSRPAEVEKEYILHPGENMKDKIHKNLFVKVQVDKTNCYVGEPIVATYKLYTRLNSESRVTRHPSLNGFSVYDMVDPGTDVVSVEKLNGKSFTVHIIRKTQLIPLQAGSIDLDPVEVQNVVHFVKGQGHQQARSSGNSLRDLFDQMTEENMGPEIEENVTLDTKPVTINVKPLPEDHKPADFSGAVGSFSLQAEIPASISARDEATLHIVVKGKGNLPVVNAPTVQWPAGIEAFDPKAKEDIDRTVVPMSGTKSFDYLFTPRAPGQYTIPAVSLSYFDPVSKSYKRAESSPLNFQVTPPVKGHEKTDPSVLTASASPGSTGGMKGFVQAHLEWIFAVLILSAVAVFLGRQNMKLKRTRKEDEDGIAAGSKGQTGGLTGRTSNGKDQAGEQYDRFGAGNNRSGAENDRSGAGNDRSGAGKDRTSGEKDRTLDQKDQFDEKKYQAGGQKSSASWKNDPFAKDGQNEAYQQGKTPDQTESTHNDAHRRQPPPIPAFPSSFGIETDPLQDAKRLFEDNNYTGFYREVNRAIWKAIAAKTNLPASELNKNRISRQLMTWGWDQDNINALESILNECEMNLYTPAYDTYNMQQLLRQAGSLLEKLG